MNLDVLEKSSLVLKFDNTDNIQNDISTIIDSAKKFAYQAVDIALVQRNWLIGCRIATEELKGNNRADYGKEIIKNLAKYLTEKYGKGFTKTNLYSFLSFYKLFPNIFHSVSGKSQQLLSWTHYRILIRIEDKDAREWYAKEAYEQTWSVRTLQRNIETLYYFRLLKSKHKEPVIQEMQEKTAKYQNDKLEFIKNPIVAEFLGYQLSSDYNETELETCIINNIQNFLMELGKGYAFVARQQHIHTEKEEYFIDLVFYNYILKCFVLIDLKTKKIRHQDVGQMDMYVRMYDELRKSENDNPTIGLILCTETDEDIAKYSVLKGNEQLFASIPQPYLPDEEELRTEILHEKTIYEMQKKNISQNCQ